MSEDELQKWNNKILELLGGDVIQENWVEEKDTFLGFITGGKRKRQDEQKAEITSVKYKGTGVNIEKKENTKPIDNRRDRFCTSCGTLLSREERYCHSCGVAVQEENINKELKNNDELLVKAEGEKQKSPEDNTIRQQSFVGTIRKCPNCGEAINSFNVKCPTCGFEFREVEISSSIKAFSDELKSASSIEQMVSIIKNYPIPNTREDIIEFLLLATTNIKGADSNEIFDAWATKIEQSYSKAELSLKEDRDFGRVRSLYDEAREYIKRRRRATVAKKIGKKAIDASTCLPQTIVSGTWVVMLIVLLPLCNKNLDSQGQNGYHVFYIFMCIIGAVFLPYALASTSSLPTTVLMIGVIITVILLVPMTHTYVDHSGASPFQLLLIAEIICLVIVFFRTIRKKRKR